MVFLPKDHGLTRVGRPRETIPKRSGDEEDAADEKERLLSRIDPRATFVAIDFETANYRPASACAVGPAQAEHLEIVRRETCLLWAPTYGGRCAQQSGIRNVPAFPFTVSCRFRGFWLQGHFERRKVQAASSTAVLRIHSRYKMKPRFPNRYPVL